MSAVMEILGVRVSVTNLDEAVQRVDHWIQAKSPSYVCVAPVSTIMEAQDDTTFRGIVNAAGMVTPDGMPLVWTGQWRGEKSIGRTYGPDLMLALCQKGEAKGYRHFLYGANESTNKCLIERLKERFPKMNIVGHWAPPQRTKEQLEDEQVLKMIDNCAPDILWIGLGCPKQEYWMHHHRPKMKVPVMIGVGAAFDFLAGVKKQAPRWMQRSGLEWAFRLSTEPGRLWRRYLIGNTRFVWLLVKSTLSPSREGKNP